MRRPVCEILAPAGDAEMLRAAVYSGADAVYLGLTALNARSSAGNFTPEQLKEAVRFCHGRDVKVYVTLNTLLYPEELAELENALRAVAEAGADAVLVQDLGAAVLAKKCVPQLPLHASTQMSIHTLQGAKMLEKMGFSRAVLARELSLEEIRAIRAGCGIELECFVHGALCMGMSGQCMMSAFLGGRSGNRGSCAGPCRLPFAADGSGKAHLSLKDMSLLDHWAELEQAGMCSAKIEGRLRTPEYVAAVVTACRAARSGGEYDKGLVRDVFSRSGFTDAHLTGKRDGRMFGVRTEADMAAAKAALPRARELFRREFGKTPVDFTLTVEAEGAKLRVTDGAHAAVTYLEDEPQPAQREQRPAQEKALAKTGGTPFYARDIKIESEGEWFLPAGALNEARRAVLEALLAKREETPAWEFTARMPEKLPRRAMPQEKTLWVRCETMDQLPKALPERVEKIVLPIAQAGNVPPALRARTILELPRAMYGALEADTARRIGETKDMGFAGYEANNLAHFALCRGLPVYGGLGLNVENPLAARAAVSLGAKSVLAQPELPADRMAAVAPGVPVGAIGYGHLPLMLTRACPMHNVHDCKNCSRKGELTDRKNRKFPVRCGLGVRTVYNPVPLYMGDKPGALCCDYELLRFTIETPARVREVLEMYLRQEAFDGELTRGLYFK